MAAPSANLPTRAHALADALRAFNARWKAKPLPAGKNAQSRMDAAVVERYFAYYAAQVQMIRDEAAARGFEEAGLNALCDDLYVRTEIIAVAQCLDELANKIRR